MTLESNSLNLRNIPVRTSLKSFHILIFTTLGAQACVLAFSTTDRVSFEAIEMWKKKVENEVGDIPMVLVQNKIDLVDQAQVTE